MATTAPLDLRPRYSDSAASIAAHDAALRAVEALLAITHPTITRQERQGAAVHALSEAELSAGFLSRCAPRAAG